MSGYFAPAPMTHSDFSGEFLLDHGLIYLNHAAVSPWPRRTAVAVQQFAEKNMRQVPLGWTGLGRCLDHGIT